MSSPESPLFASFLFLRHMYFKWTNQQVERASNDVKMLYRIGAFNIIFLLKMFKYIGFVNYLHQCIGASNVSKICKIILLLIFPFLRNGDNVSKSISVRTDIKFQTGVPLSWMMRSHASCCNCQSSIKYIGAAMHLAPTYW